MAPIEIDDDDDDELPSMVQTSRARNARESSRRSVSRASSVASSSKGGASHASARTAGSSRGTTASTSRPARARSSVSATSDPVGSFEQAGLPNYGLESDTPTVAAYNARAAARTSGGSQTPPPKPKAKAKRAVLDPKAQAELARRQLEEDEADDFFTHKPTLSFRTKKPASKTAPQHSRSASTSAPTVSSAKDTQNDTSNSPPPSASKGKGRVIELDDDDTDSLSSEGSSSDSDDADSDPYDTKAPQSAKKPKSKKKKVQPDVRRTSPLKRAEPDYDSSSSSSSALSFISDASVQRVRKDKHQGKNKRPSPPPKRERSLSPIETLDSYVLAHALHDVRRKHNARRPESVDDGGVNGSEFVPGGDDAEASTSRTNGSARSPAPEEGASRQVRSPSAGATGVLPVRATSFSLTPLPEAKPQTEEDLEAKYGAAIQIRVEMVYDPRLPITDINREQVRKYESAVIVRTREKETFHRLFTAISGFKSVPKEQLAFTYNGRTVFQSGSPSAIKIISSATFNGYTKDVLAYVKQHGEGVLKRHNDDIANAVATSSAPIQTSTSLHSGAAPTISNGARESTAPPMSTTGQSGPENSHQSPQAPSAPPLRLTIRGGPDQKVQLAVPPTKTVLSVIKAFLRKFKIDQDKAGQCKLLFDGEEMDHELQLMSTDVEDEDTLDVKVPGG